MIRLLGEEWEGDVRVRWYEDDASDEVIVERWQDPQSTIDMVATVNSEGAPVHDGLGRPVCEVPVAVAMKFCEDRGIPWEKFLYGNDYDEEYLTFAREYSRLAYRSVKKFHAVGGSQ